MLQRSKINHKNFKDQYKCKACVLEKAWIIKRKMNKLRNKVNWARVLRVYRLGREK
jgi:hypothetical protein